MKFSLIFVAVCLAFASAIPNNLNVRPISRNAVRISWLQDYSSQLKGYTIHYHNGDDRTTEWKTKTIWDPRASEAIIDGLRSEGEYSFCVRSIMTGKVCACSEQVHVNLATGSVAVNDHGDSHNQQHTGHQQTQHQQTQHQQQTGLQQGYPTQTNIELLEAGTVGGDYVQLRWRYDGPKPVKYLITYRGYHRFQIAEGRWEDKEVDVGAPVESEEEHFVVQGLRPDTTYVFEVTVVDKTTGRPISRPQSTRVSTKEYIL